MKEQIQKILAEDESQLNKSEGSSRVTGKLPIGNDTEGIQSDTEKGESDTDKVKSDTEKITDRVIT